MGTCTVKYKIRKRIQDAKLVYANLVHPSVIFGKGAALSGEGIVIQAGTILAPYCVIKSYVTINLDATIGHDAIVEEYATIAPGVHLSGFSRIGRGSNVGTGCAVIEGVSVGKECVLGANAAVIRNIPDYSVAVGVPAKVIKTVSPQIEG